MVPQASAENISNAKNFQSKPPCADSEFLRRWPKNTCGGMIALPLAR